MRILHLLVAYYLYMDLSSKNKKIIAGHCYALKHFGPIALP